MYGASGYSTTSTGTLGSSCLDRAAELSQLSLPDETRRCELAKTRFITAPKHLEGRLRYRELEEHRGVVDQDDGVAPGQAVTSIDDGVAAGWKHPSKQLEEIVFECLAQRATEPLHFGAGSDRGLAHVAGRRPDLLLDPLEPDGHNSAVLQPDERCSSERNRVSQREPLWIWSREGLTELLP